MTMKANRVQASPRFWLLSVTRYRHEHGELASLSGADFRATSVRALDSAPGPARVARSAWFLSVDDGQMNDRPMPEGFPKLDKQTRPWQCRNDDPTCTRAAPCRADLGARNRRKGLVKQREARKTLERATGTSAGRYASTTGNEENWRLSARVEIKSGKQVQPIATRYVAARAQSDAGHATGDPRPFVFVAVPDGWPAGKFLLTVHSDDLDALGLAIVGELS